LDRAKLLALTPGKFLKGGFVDPDGRALPELQGEWATAAAMQLLEAGVSLMELSATLEALRLTLPVYEAAPRERFRLASREALEVVSMMQHGQKSHPAVARWLAACAPAIRSEDDLTAMLDHFLAVVRQLGVIGALTESDE
jgi:hypothetical protein